jgi:predicted dehydrogenase
MNNRSTRRQFLKNTAALSAGVWIATRGDIARAVAANDRLNVGIIGVANRGRANLNELLKLKNVHIAAMCDVDQKNLADATEDCPDASQHTDFRKMLEAEKKLDAVLIATADHTHAPATMMALKMGRHVYCEKPLAHNVFEARRVTEEATNRKLVSQMGTQIHAGENYRRVVELIQSGAIGPVREVHVMVEKDWGATGPKPTGSFPPVPAGLNYDAWLGPAQEWPYSPEWLPANWRRWWNFGNGTLGDMGCHYMDLPFWALGLKHPTTIGAEGPAVSPDGCPNWLIVNYQFPARGEQPPVKLSWYDGGKKPKAFAEWGLDAKVDNEVTIVDDKGNVQTKARDKANANAKAWDNGVVFVGDKGILVANYSKYLLLPEKNFTGFQPPKPTIAKSIGHHAEWVNACLGKNPAATTCNFGYSGLLSETVLLGTVAYRAGKTIEWDGEKLEVKNSPEAQRLIKREYRKGWEIA